jgi:murein peptide amidase A
MQRLGKNLGGYFGETINLVEVLREIETTAAANGWISEDFLHLGAYRLFAIRRSAGSNLNHKATRVYISTGIHGDEPAGPLAVLQLLRDNQWPPNCELWLCPCLNPAGFVLNRRENDKGVDLNRDYLHLQSDEIRAHVAWLQRQPPFDLCLCLHEDWESHGFYVYELNPDGRPSLASAIVAGVDQVCPIDRSEIIEGRTAQGGIIRPNVDPRSRPQWPEAFWLLTHKTRLSYTLEAPSDFALTVRVNALVHGVHAALACPLLNSSPAG